MPLDSPLINMGELESGASEIVPSENISPPKPSYFPTPHETPVPKVDPPGFIPTLISIGAAAKGNFGPLWEISEQKRKTQIFKDLGGIAAETDRRINSGDTQGGIDFFNKAATQLGGRAPEIAQMIPQYLQRFNIIQDRMNSQKITAGKLKVYAAEAEARGNDVIADQYKRAYSALKELTNMAPMNQEQLTEFLDRMGVKDVRIDASGNRQTAITGLGTTTTTAIPQFSAEKDFGSDTAQDKLLSDPELTKAFQTMGIPLTLSNLINVMNTRSPMLTGLQDIISKRTNIARDYALQLKEGAQIPIDPIAALEMMRKGTSRSNLATRNIAPGEVKSGAEITGERAYAQSAAGVEALMDQPISASYPDRVAVTNEPGNDFHGQLDEGISLRNAMSAKNKAVLPRDIYYNKLVPTYNVLSGLDYVSDIFDPLRNPEGKYDKISSGLITSISSAIGISLDPGVTKAQAARAIVAQALNKVDDLGTLPRKDTGDLRRYLTGAFADPTGSEKAMEFIKGRVEQGIGKFINHSKIPSSELKPKLAPETSTFTINKDGKVVDNKGKVRTDLDFLTDKQKEIYLQMQQNQPGLPEGTRVTPQGITIPAIPGKK